jgi:ABC-type amino acid transport substrate-binding protein
VVFNDYLNTLHYIKKNNSSLLVVSDSQEQVIFLSNASLGIAVQKGNHSLREVINTTLAEMRSNDTLSDLFQEYISPDISE